MDSIIENEEEEQFVVSQPENDAVNNDNANLPRSLSGYFDIANQRK